MTESVRDASISRQNSSSKLTPQTTLNPATCNQLTPQSAINSDHKIPSWNQKRDSFDDCQQLKAATTVDKEVDL